MLENISVRSSTESVRRSVPQWAWPSWTSDHTSHPTAELFIISLSRVYKIEKSYVMKMISCTQVQLALLVCNHGIHECTREGQNLKWGCLKRKNKDINMLTKNSQPLRLWFKYIVNHQNLCHLISETLKIWMFWIFCENVHCLHREKSPLMCSNTFPVYPIQLGTMLPANQSSMWNEKDWQEKDCVCFTVDITGF